MTNSWTGRQDSVLDRIYNIGKLIDRERDPVKRKHYRNVLIQLQSQLESL